MYAVIDIETTGGQYNQEGITEIAIYKFDGAEVVDQFISLVNPEIPIQPFVVKLTGINNAMLRSAPKFYEVAKRIIEITDNCVLVAHNAQFDYRILKTEFKRLGYDFNTVEFAVRDGIPYAIDFCNPAPDADLASVGQENFDWVVEASASYAIERALEQKDGADNLTWGEYVKRGANKLPLY